MAEFTEATLEVLVEERVQDWVQAAVYVAQGDAEMHEHHRLNASQVEAQRLRQGHDLDGRPAHDEGSDHHQHHARDAPKVAVFLLGPRQDADAAETFYHQAVAHADDRHGNKKGEEEDACTKHRIPVAARVGQDQDALDA